MNTIYTIIQEFKGTKLDKNQTTKKAFTVSTFFFTDFKQLFCPNTMQAFIYVFFLHISCTFDPKILPLKYGILKKKTILHNSIDNVPDLSYQY